MVRPTHLYVRMLDETTPSMLAWNRQLVLLAHAVLLGRHGKPTQAAETVHAAQQVAAPFTMARHLGLRLIAEAALTDGWGEPVSWLRAAEEYFHAAHVPAVASACRALLRRAGVSVGQHRTGQERIPPELRRLGVTFPNSTSSSCWWNAGATRRSPAVCTCHRVRSKNTWASLIAKTRQADRAALSAYGAQAIKSMQTD